MENNEATASFLRREERASVLAMASVRSIVEENTPKMSVPAGLLKCYVPYLEERD